MFYVFREEQGLSAVSVDSLELLMDRLEKESYFQVSIMFSMLFFAFSCFALLFSANLCLRVIFTGNNHESFRKRYYLIFLFLQHPFC